MARVKYRSEGELNAKISRISFDLVIARVPLSNCSRVVRATLTAPVYSYRVYVYSLRGMVSSSSSSSSTLVNGSRCARRLVKIRFRADYADREEERTANCELRVDDRRTRVKRRPRITTRIRVRANAHARVESRFDSLRETSTNFG